MKKRMLILVLVLIGTSSLFAQRKYPPPVYMSKDEAEDQLSHSVPKLSASIGLLNLFHPTAASLDLGVEYRPSREFGLELLYGLRSPRFRHTNFKNRLELDTYHKAWAVFKFYRGRKSKLGRLNRDNFIRNASFSSYLGLEGYAAWGKSLLKNDYALTPREKIEYFEADLRKRVWGVGLRMGWRFFLGERMELECSYGSGALFFNRKYTLINTQHSNRGFGFLFKGPYDDRMIGRRVALNFLCQLKLSYRIF